MDTLQFFSVKVASIDDSLQWPLDVYGFVAVRDVLDRKRNMIFWCDRDNCQTINQQDPYLALTGPTRGVAVSGDPCYFEVKLKLKGTSESEDKDCSLFASTYRPCCPKRMFTSKLSTLEMSFQELFNSVEATISVEVIDGSWPDGFRGEFSASTDNPPDMKVNLLKCVDDKLPVGADGKIQLTRRIVSVELEGFLKVSIIAHCVDVKPKIREAIFAPERCDYFGTNFKTKMLLVKLKIEHNTITIFGNLSASKAEGSQSIVWIDNPPEFIYELLADDVNYL
ncbi:hypothetical protein QYE76_030364 [Lolium multiflorum]|uniref:DUF6598 domain-containing protein n=1 Tax=Lolium multiflorum TaxID=4521 RepID=A0AAD8QPS1_LOLMU|nr:hypothetical protein QYE76_030364 [Lolium multiflorum]